MLHRRVLVWATAVGLTTLGLVATPAQAVEATTGDTVLATGVAAPDATVSGPDATVSGPDGTAERAGRDVRVASFNVKNVLFAKNPTRDWKQRRKVIIRQIIDEGIGIIGIQEAHPGRHIGVDFPDGANQYLDLRNGLRKAGPGKWQVTSAHSFNCVNSDTWQNCTPKYRAASRSTRILYNANAFEMVKRGSVLYRKQKAEDRYLVWAVFEIRATGKRFLFTTTHLTSASEEVRLRQWRQMIRKIDDLRGRKPVIVTGDFNVQKYHWIAGKMLPAMKQAGYGDVLNQQYSTNPTPDPRAESMVNGWINSFNHGRRDVRTFSFHDQRHKIGNSIDWIFASNRLEVKRWKVVLDFDRDTLEVEGPLASDHNMVTATIHLP